MAVRSASKPKKAKRAKRAPRRATRRAARKASKPKAPKRVARKSKRVARKAKKTKRVTKKMQTGSKFQVWSGTKLYTKSGYMKKDLIKNKHGNVVFKNKSKANNGSKWAKAFVKARKEFGITGFVTINRGAKGVALYKRTKEIYGM